VLVHGGAVADHIADGEAEIGIHQISEILPVKGAALVGPLPAEIQNFTIYSAGLGVEAKDHAAAVGLIKFLSGPHALPIIKDKGMAPPGWLWPVDQGVARWADIVAMGSVPPPRLVAVVVSSDPINI
jgi:hypothetical protein